MDIIDDLERLIKIAKEYPKRNLAATHVQNLISSTRGPDNEPAPRLKYSTTARCRAIAFPHYDGDINPSPLDQQEMAERDSLCRTGHFNCHYISAVAALRDLFNYDLRNEKEI